MLLNTDYMNREKTIICMLNGVTENDGKPSISGGDVRALKIMQEFSRQKWQVVVFSSTIGTKLVDGFKSKNWEIVDIQTNEKGNIWSRFSRVWQSVVAVRKWVKENSKRKRVERAVCYSSCEHLYDVLPAWWLSVFNNMPWIALIHWVPDSPFGNNRGNTPFIYNLIYYVQNFISHVLIKNRAQTVLAVSNITRDKLVKCGFDPKKLESVYCGVDLQAIEKVKPKGVKKYDAVFLKRLNPGKGSMDLVKIWRKVVTKKPRAKLMIIGDGPQDLVSEIKNDIVKNGLENNIILHGPEYDFKIKFCILKQSRLFMLPTYEENWAIVIGEALSAGLPVVCYDLPEIKPIWKDAVNWVKKGNTNAMAKKVLSILNSRVKKRELPKVVLDNSWEAVGRREVEIVESCFFS